ncbi:MAG: hypothetical protein PHY16_00440 [Methylobacter sp.]|nr:hypothetical protein [Methylobacter sp.]
MKANNTSKIPDANVNDDFDTFCQEFDGGSFYGLEYILEDFFQRTKAKPSEPARPSVDWFGLYE